MKHESCYEENSLYICKFVQLCHQLLVTTSEKQILQIELRLILKQDILRINSRTNPSILTGFVSTGFCLK